jgi:hypothetical protein
VWGEKGLGVGHLKLISHGPVLAGCVPQALEVPIPDPHRENKKYARHKELIWVL